MSNRFDVSYTNSIFKLRVHGEKYLIFASVPSPVSHLGILYENIYSLFPFDKGAVPCSLQHCARVAPRRSSHPSDILQARRQIDAKVPAGFHGMQILFVLGCSQRIFCLWVILCSSSATHSWAKNKRRTLFPVHPVWRPVGWEPLILLRAKSHPTGPQILRWDLDLIPVVMHIPTLSTPLKN